MHLDEYMDKAIKIQGLKSDKDIPRKMGMGIALASQWRTKRAWPSDTAMIKLAELAGEDPKKALMDLNIWRSEGAARSLYEQIAKRAIQMLMVAGLSSAMFTAPTGETKAEQLNIENSQSIHYANLLMALITLVLQLIKALEDNNTALVVVKREVKRC